MSLFTSPRAYDLADVRAAGRVAGTLRIKCPRPDVREELCERLRHAGAAHLMSGESIDVPTGDFDGLALELSGWLSAEEQTTAHASFSPDGRDEWAHSCCLHCILREALGRWVGNLFRPGGLSIVFQPIVRCGRSEVFGFEALMRAGDRIVGPFDATRVLAAARQAGLALQLVRHACDAAVTEAARHRINTKLFINVTPASLCNAGRGAAEAVGVLEALRLSPHQIVFELAESEPVADWKRLREALASYRECGFQVALDDFGAAYSSPMSLCELRPDYVKLDRALIGGVHRDPCRAMLTSKLVEAAHAFGAKVVAEGVETAGEYEWVARRGVEFAQGFYISRPAAPPPFMCAA